MTKKNNRKEIINKVAGRLIELLKTEGSNWKKSEVWNSSEFGFQWVLGFNFKESFRYNMDMNH